MVGASLDPRYDQLPLHPGARDVESVDHLGDSKPPTDVQATESPVIDGGIGGEKTGVCEPAFDGGPGGAEPAGEAGDGGAGSRVQLGESSGINGAETTTSPPFDAGISKAGREMCLADAEKAGDLPLGSAVVNVEAAKDFWVWVGIGPPSALSG
jgi:hypothetical protein